MANNFLPFCPTDTGTNLLTQGDYAVAADRTNGNQPGVASSKLNNKALRQSSMVASQLAQLVSDVTGTDTLDNGVTAQLLAQLSASLVRIPPVMTTYNAGASGSHDLSYVFFIASGNATAAATYTNNGVTFTVKSTVAAGVQVSMTGNSAPAVNGTLTKTSGTGDTTLTFYAFRKPLTMKVIVQAGGGGGSATNGSPNAGTAGGNSTFDSITCNGGAAGQSSNAGAVAAATGGDINISGGAAGCAISTSGTAGIGGSSYLGSGGGGANGTGTDGSGYGAGGASGAYFSTPTTGGGGGAAAIKTYTNPSGTFAFSVGNAGAAGSAGVWSGGAGTGGIIILKESYQ